MTRTTDRDARPQLIWRHYDPDGIIDIQYWRVPAPPGRELQALPRPVPPQEEPRRWWHWRRPRW